MYTFKDAQDLEHGLEPEELCVASIPNTKAHGYKNHVGLVYKSQEGDVFSLVAIQHHGELKEGTDVAMGVSSQMMQTEDLEKDPLPKIKSKRGWKFWQW